MVLSKKLRQALLVSASALMILGLGMPALTINTTSVNASRRRISRRARVRYHRGRRTRRGRKVRRTRRHVTRRRRGRKARRTRRTKRTRRRRVAKHHVYVPYKYKMETLRYWDDPSVNQTQSPSFAGHTSNFTKGFEDAKTEDNESNMMNDPCINIKLMGKDGGIANNYELGWVAGTVNGNEKDDFMPHANTKLNRYRDAINQYNSEVSAIRKNPNGEGRLKGTQLFDITFN